MKNCDFLGSNVLYFILKLTLYSNLMIVLCIVALYCVLEITVPFWVRISKFDHILVSISKTDHILVSILFSYSELDIFEKSNYFQKLIGQECRPVTQFLCEQFHYSECAAPSSPPREGNPFVYIVDCLGNIVGGKRIIYNNQPIDVLMNLT